MGNPDMAKGSNRWATMSRASAAKPKPKVKPKRGTRRPLDDYETPGGVTLALFAFLQLKRGAKVLEPCAGTGRMARAIKSANNLLKITTADIKRGADFLKRKERFAGHCISNPPYRDGLAESITRKALSVCDGKVAMLLQSGFVWGGRRADGMYLDGLKPELIVIIPWRIIFIDGDGKPISGQFFSHCWVVWPERTKRATNTTTRVEWASPEFAEVV